MPTALPALFASLRIAAPLALIGAHARRVARHRQGPRLPHAAVGHAVRLQPALVGAVLVTIYSIVIYSIIAAIEKVMLAKYAATLARWIATRRDGVGLAAGVLDEVVEAVVGRRGGRRRTSRRGRGGGSRPRRRRWRAPRCATGPSGAAARRRGRSRRAISPGTFSKPSGMLVGAAEVRAGHDAQEPVLRRRRVDVDRERHRRPHVEVRARLVVGVPADARVARLHRRGGRPGTRRRSGRPRAARPAAPRSRATTSTTAGW